MRPDLARTLAISLAALALLAGCSGDDDSADHKPGRSTTTSTTTTTQPPASDEDTAFKIVNDLVTEATSLVDELFQHPTVVNDPNDPEITRLHELYTKDSPTPQGVITQLKDLAKKGQHERAAPASGIFRDLGIYRMTTIDDNTIRFVVCALEDTETVDENDKVVKTTAQVVQGSGEARRIRGVWLFYGIHPENDRTLPFAPGTGKPGFCDRLFSGQEAGA